MMRDLTFAVHGISELSFAGASFALLVGFNVVIGSILGSLIAALVIGVLGVRARERSSIIGVLMPFGLGLGVLFLALYPGRSANKFGLLTGQIVAVDDPQLLWMLGVSVVVLAALAIMWRPLMFATVDPEIAAARGVPVRALSPIFMIVLGLTVAMAVQVVGALLVLALLVTPGSGRDAGDRVGPLGAGAVGGVRHGVGGRRDPDRARRQPADQPVRHHDLVRDLRDLPDRREPQDAARLGATTAAPRGHQDPGNTDPGTQQNGRTAPVETGVVRPS